MNQNLIARAIQKVMPAVRATGLLVSLATFQSSDAADYPDGFASGTYVDVAGLVDLPCMAAPENPSYLAADETKAQEVITAMAYYHVTFGAVYPALADGWRAGWRVVIDGIAYDVLGVGVDSQGQHSVCKVRLVTI